MLSSEKPSPQSNEGSEYISESDFEELAQIATQAIDSWREMISFAQTYADHPLGDLLVENEKLSERVVELVERNL